MAAEQITKTDFIKLILERLMIKRTVACFEDFEQAQAYLMLELFPTHSEHAKRCEDFWKWFAANNKQALSKWWENPLKYTMEIDEEKLEEFDN